MLRSRLRSSISRPSSARASSSKSPMPATHGDLSENAEYHAAKEQQGITEARVADLEDKLSRADIIDVSKLKGDQVMFGATVTLVDEDTDDKAKYRIVGEIEANVKQGQISITSPLARALLGKRKKDVVEVSTRAAASRTRCSRSNINSARPMPWRRRAGQPAAG